jgi:hypothetical protein
MKPDKPMPRAGIFPAVLSGFDFEDNIMLRIEQVLVVDVI